MLNHEKNFMEYICGCSGKAAFEFRSLVRSCPFQEDCRKKAAEDLLKKFGEERMRKALG